MEQVIKNTDQIDSGFFVKRSAITPSAMFDGQNVLFLTQENNPALKIKIIDLILSSKKYLKICSFLITDDEILDTILKKAKEQTVAIFILTQLDESKFSTSSFFADEEASLDESKKHLDSIKKLYEQSVHIRAGLTTHAKFIVSDGNTALITSANFTTPSLTFNTESGFITDSNTLKSLELLFDVIYQKGTQYKRFISSGKKKQLVIQGSTQIEKSWLPNPQVSCFRYTFGNLTNNLYEGIIDVITSAKEYLYISTYSIVDLDKIPLIKSELEKALKRGVDVKIFCRGMNHRNDHLYNCRLLNDIGIKIFADFFNHSKGVLNESKSILFTANIDGKHGLINGFEVGFFLDSVQQNIFRDFHKYLFDSSEFEFKHNPSRLEIMDTAHFYESRKNIKPPVFSENLIVKSNKITSDHIETFKKFPIYYGRIKEKGQCLSANNLIFSCLYKDGVFTIKEKLEYSFPFEKYILKFNNLKFQ